MKKPLTPRELQVLKLVAVGQGNRQIAEELHISARTVEGHRARAMLKLELKTIADIVKYAVRSHLIDV